MTSDSPDLVWHYTSLGTLISILKDRSLRATEVRFQNDPREALTARDALASLVKRAGSPSSDFARQALEIFDGMWARSPWDVNDEWLLKSSRFVLCASTDGDNFTNWRTYGSVGAVGCAIGLDRHQFLGVISETTSSAEAWENVVYSEDDLYREFLADFQDFARDWEANEHPYFEVPRTGLLMSWLDRLWPALRSRAKHPSYVEEREARVTVLAPAREVIEFADGRFGPRPFIRLGSTPQRLTDPTGHELLPIRALRLSPDAPEAAFDSARWLLSMNGYRIDGKLVEPHYHLDKSERVPVLKSQHTYRAV